MTHSYCGLQVNGSPCRKNIHTCQFLLIAEYRGRRLYRSYNRKLSSQIPEVSRVHQIIMNQEKIN